VLETSYKPFNVPGSPYWCGVRDKKAGHKFSPHWYPSIMFGVMTRVPRQRMMQAEIADYELGYNGESK
jgi:hypothetical protein